LTKNYSIGGQWPDVRTWWKGDVQNICIKSLHIIITSVMLPAWVGC